ncbi:MAG: hypothetical protein VKL39_17665 [Leptolyngbyaceae bacterium]|nr:hypothetical protein [Leptolyngbyaceae bacterium]
MSQVPLAPPPRGNDDQTDRWLWLLWRRLTQAGQILWASLDFGGSNLTDLETRNHNDLQSLQGGTTDEYYHLTSAQNDIINRFAWNDTDGTLDIQMGYDDVVQQVGLEQYFHVKNQTGAQLTNGYVARAVGTVGNSGQILASYAIADGSHLARYVLGVLTMDIADGADGFVTEFGLVRGFDTTGTLFGETWNDGDILFLSPTTAGYLTKVEPTAPNLRIVMAIVIHAHANGSIFVRPTHGGKLNDVHDVYVPTPSAGQLLTYDYDASRWEARTPTADDGVTITDNGSSITVSLDNFVGDSGAGGVIGAVPAPAAGDADISNRKYLCADGTWRAPQTSADIEHDNTTGLMGGIATNIFESTAFESTAFQTEGVTQYYHVTAAQFNDLERHEEVATVSINTTMDDSYATYIADTSAITLTLPAATVERIGKTWTVVMNCNGYVDVEPDPTDEFILYGGSDTIRLDEIGSTLVMRCISTTQWVIT